MNAVIPIVGKTCFLVIRDLRMQSLESDVGRCEPLNHLSTVEYVSVLRIERHGPHALKRSQAGISHTTTFVVTLYWSLLVNSYIRRYLWVMGFCQ
jgi:hypothetical protein